METWFLYVPLISGFLNGIIVMGFPDVIRVGAIFDRNSGQTQMAFNYAIQRHNNKQSSFFKLHALVSTVNASDSYSLNATLCRQLSDGVFVMFSSSNQESLNTMTSLTEAVKMPYILPTAVPKLFRYQYTKYQVKVSPPYLEAMIDLIKKHKWNKVHYIYNDDEGLMRIHYITQAIRTNRADRKREDDSKFQLDAHHLPSLDNSYAILRKIDKWDNNEVKSIIIDIEKPEEVQMLLGQITLIGMNKAGYHYLIGGVEMKKLNLDNFKYGGVNITGFNIRNYQHEALNAFSKEWNRLHRFPKYSISAGQSEIGVEATLMVDAVDLFVRALNKIFRHGIVFNNNTEGIKCNIDPPEQWMHGDKIMEAIHAASAESLNGPVWIGNDGACKNYALDIIDMSLNKGTLRIGNWSYETGLSHKKHTTTGKLKDSELKQLVSILLNPPYTMKRHSTTDGIPVIGKDKYEGYCIDLIKWIAKEAGFSYELKQCPDGNHGVLLKNGTWNGMIGELVKNRADLAIGDLTIDSERERAVDFSKPFMTLGISIQIMIPQKQQSGFFSFMDPLHITVWICIMCAYIGVSVVLFVVCKYSPYEQTDDFTLYNSFWFSLGCFMQQGADVSPSSPSGRIAGIAWWFFTLIIISSYTANLAAFLTVEHMVIPVKSADDLVRQNDIKYGTIDSGTTKTFFENSDTEVFKKMWDVMSKDESVFVNSVEDGVKRVRTSKEKYAFLLDSPTNDYHNQRQPCSTMKAGNNLDSKGFGVASRNGNPWKNAITLAILKLHENGELLKLKTRWWDIKGECGPDGDKKGSGGKSAMSLSNVSGIFYILIGGLGLAMIMSVVETIYKSKMEAKRKKKTFKDALTANTVLAVRGTTQQENEGFQNSPAHFIRSTSCDGTQV